MVHIRTLRIKKLLKKEVKLLNVNWMYGSAPSCTQLHCIMSVQISSCTDIHCNIICVMDINYYFSVYKTINILSNMLKK